MNNLSTSVESLFNLALYELSYSMNEDLLKSILKNYPTSIIFKILWKILHIENETNEFVYYHTLDYMESPAYKRGSELVLLLTTDRHPHYLMKTQSEVLDNLTKFQQLMFFDKLNFCNYFDLELFFKFIEYTYHRNDLLVIFQICVQKKGMKFPKQFAKKWTESKTEDEINLHHIERGLKLGIFLGDSGWFSESALVLSYTYKIISAKWVYSDQNLKLTQSIQCLTKWLLVVTYYHDFDEAKVILSHILNNIELLEQTEGRHLHIINAYIALSEYYFVIVDYDASWLWASKAVNELHEEMSSDYLKLLVMSHCIKVCSSTNKLIMAKKIMEKLFTDKDEVNPNFCVDIFRNIAYHLFQDDSSNFQNYFVALDSSRNLFGYYNLHTANIFVDYAYARYVMNYPRTDLKHVISSITQGIYIMEKIGIPNGNMMLVNARMLKSFMLQKITFFNIPHPHTLGLIIPLTNVLNKNIRDSESYHMRAIELSKKTFGEESMFTARLLYYLGKLYQEQQRVLSYKLLRFNVLLLATSRTALYYAESQTHINSLYDIRSELNIKAEQAYLNSIKIYETICGPEYFWLLHLYERLLELYVSEHAADKHEACLQKIHSFKERVLKKEEFPSLIKKMHEHYLNDCTSLEFCKSMIINDID